MNNSYLPLINTDRNSFQDFYSICINAIKKNKSGIMNKAECIKNIEKLRHRQPLMKTKKKFLSHSSIFKYETAKKAITFRESHKMNNNIFYNKKITLGDILKKYKKLEIKPLIKIPPIDTSNQEMNNNDNEQKNKNEDNEKNKENKENKEKVVKIHKGIFSSNKEEIKEIKEINPDKSTNKSSLRSQTKQRTSLIKQKNEEKMKKPYKILRKVTEYLESNDITLFQFIKHNPFQKRPYQISKSFEFLSAVKFKNYEFVIEALQFSNAYLFCFDYYGQTCYHWAAKLSNVKMLMLLIDYGKYVNQKDFKGRTPLYLAAVNNDREICEILIRNKANVHFSDNNGFTPADVAGSKELRYYLGDLMTQPYSNPSYKQRTADFLRERDDIIEKRRMMELKKKMEEEERIKKAKEELGEDEENLEEE